MRATPRELGPAIRLKSFRLAWVHALPVSLMLSTAMLLSPARITAYFGPQIATAGRSWKDMQAIFADGINFVRFLMIATAALYILTIRFGTQLRAPSAQPRRPSAAPKDILACAALLATAVALRIPNLTASFWWDELSTLVRVVRRGLPVILAFSANANNHIMNSLMMLGMAKLFGESEWIVRLPAFALGALTPPAVYWSALRVVSRRAALGLGFLFAGHFRCVADSAEARGYAGALLFAVLSCFLFHTLWSGFRRFTGVSYVLSATLAAGFHFVSILIPVSHLIGAASWSIYAAALRRRGRIESPRPWLPFTCAWGVVGGLALNSLHIPQLVSYSHAAPEHTRMGSALVSGTLTYLSGGSHLSAACLVVCLALAGWIRQFKEVRLFLAFAYPGLFTFVAFALTGTPASPRLFYSLLLPVVMGFIAFIESAFTSGPVLGKSLSAAAILFVIADSVPLFQNYYESGNPPLRQVGLRMGKRRIGLIGAQSDLNGYYFESCVRFRTAKDALDTGESLPDDVLTAVQCANLSSRLSFESAGFHRVYELRDWTVAEPPNSQRPCYVLLSRRRAAFYRGPRPQTEAEPAPGSSKNQSKVSPDVHRFSRSRSASPGFRAAPDSPRTPPGSRATAP